VFDFEAHRRAAIDAYQLVQLGYSECARGVYAVLTTALSVEGVRVHSIEHRAKSLNSFGTKAATPSSDDPSAPKYPNPLGDITDLSAVRVITFLLKDAQRVCQVVEREFIVLEKINRTGLLQEDAKLGYQSVHYLVRFSEPRSTLPEYARLAQTTTEIQVRTILQHAWAEIEHDLQYKALEAIPTAIRSRFTSLAGLLEIADREFQGISDEDQRVRNDARRLVAQGLLDRVEITPDALAAYLDKTFGPDGRMSDWSYSWSTRLLKHLGFRNLAQLDECLGPYNDDEVSRIIWGGRQGQLTRLEDVLLASMGELFISSHPFAGSEWYMSQRQGHLEKLLSRGFAVGQYRPGGSSNTGCRQASRPASVGGAEGQDSGAVSGKKRCS
jgi:ppGpp synthetase/RelA/SpoT-type nucleotidyltranferase